MYLTRVKGCPFKHHEAIHPYLETEYCNDNRFQCLAISGKLVRVVALFVAAPCKDCETKRNWEEQEKQEEEERKTAEGEKRKTEEAKSRLGEMASPPLGMASAALAL